MQAKNHSIFIFFWLAASISFFVISHPVRQVPIEGKERIHAYVGQARSVRIPFKKCFKAHPQLPQHDELVSFYPTRLTLSSISHYPLSTTITQTPLLTQLRTPSDHRHSELLRFK